MHDLDPLSKIGYIILLTEYQYSVLGQVVPTCPVFVGLVIFNDTCIRDALIMPAKFLE